MERDAQDHEQNHEQGHDRAPDRDHDRDHDREHDPDYDRGREPARDRAADRPADPTPDTADDTAGEAAPERTATQGQLPLDGGSSVSGRTSEGPVDYVLTARARRAVAPDTLPELTLLPGDEAIDPAEGDPSAGGGFDPHDPRPARARALRRSGRTVAAIAAVLKVDEDLAARWCADVDPARRRRGRAAGPRTTVDPGARAAAAAEVRRELDARPETAPVAIGGLVSGLASITATSVTVTPPETDLVPVVVSWLVRDGGARRDQLRVLVAAGPAVARDVVAEHWATRLDLERDQVSHAAWAEAPAPDAVRITVRVSSSTVAGRLAGWRTALRDRLGEGPVGADAEEVVPSA